MKKFIVPIILILFIVSFSVKAHFDYKGDEHDSLTIQEVETQEELDDALKICNEKKYLNPNCEAKIISFKLDNDQKVGVSDCEKIKYDSSPYYAFLSKNKHREDVNVLRGKCVEGFNSVVEIK